MAPGKRGPSVLVTDSRDRPPQNAPSIRQPVQLGHQARHPMRLISVDNVLGNASNIPSAQPRIRQMSPNPLRQISAAPAAASQSMTSSPPPSSSSALPKHSRGHRRSVSAGGLPNVQSKSGRPMPSRTTKISEKLVLIPETNGDPDADDEEIASEEARAAAATRRLTAEMALADDSAPLRDEELDVLRKRGGVRGKSYAERLPKPQRAVEKVARVTAYCTAQAFRMKDTAEFLRKQHGAKTKMYDDCLYAVYALPLLSGTDGFRLRSKPMLRTPGDKGKTVMELEIERSERRVDHEGLGGAEGYYEDYGFGDRELSPVTSPLIRAGDDRGGGSGGNGNGQNLGISEYGGFGGDNNTSPPGSPRSGSVNQITHDAKNFAEMFVYSYGVVVFWNFTEHQEKDVLADLTFAGSQHAPGQNLQAASKARVIGSASVPAPPMSLVTRPLNHEDYETEEFHFEYSADVSRPRVFNDMITLLPRSDHMVKLTISHAIAQSTKLCFFEERMSQTMLSTQHVPKNLALTGKLDMTRTDIVKILGRLFKNRVDINLSSNILDVPNFFWDSEPTLHPLYVAIREYLEIDPRIKVLNERCRVFLDLAEILSDSVSDAKMSAITWIIILLIVVSILVTVTEVALRFGMLRSNRDGAGGGSGSHGGGNDGITTPIISAVVPGATSIDDGLVRMLQLPDNVSLEDVRRWNRILAKDGGA